jgi:tRNA-binding EMAP/Myf-like protein
MKVTLNWLKPSVDFDWSPEQLAERLTMLGLEVEGVHKIAGEFEGIVVAQILTRDPVPGSDKLSMCKVNDGRGERTIICGAQNHKVGDKVPLILPNFALPLKPGDKEPFVIKERKVFGITSQGMMCSPQELGLSDQVDGLLILKTDAKIGQPFAEYLGRAPDDTVFDLEITPNRSDLNSVIGVAREIAAMTGNALRIPEVETPAVIDRRYRVVSALHGANHPGREGGAEPGLVEDGPGKRGRAQHQQRCRYHELRDARNRPTVARVRLSFDCKRQGWQADDCGAPRGGGREVYDAGRTAAGVDERDAADCR